VASRTGRAPAASQAVFLSEAAFLKEVRREIMKIRKVERKAKGLCKCKSSC
jgi:hypothetical protein